MVSLEFQGITPSESFFFFPSKASERLKIKFISPLPSFFFFFFWSIIFLFLFSAKRLQACGYVSNKSKIIIGWISWANYYPTKNSVEWA